MRGLDLRDGITGLVGYAKRDLYALWRQVRTAAEAEVALRDVLPSLIDTYGAAAGTLAADWYDDLRDKAGAGGNFRAIPADIKDPGAQELVGWATSKATDMSTMQTLVLGGMQRRISNFSRTTVSGSSIADPKSVGWKRIGVGACEFCRMLIERDVTYTEATADFASHDHCNCQAYPLIKGAEPIDVKDYVQSARSARRSGESDAAYERRRSTERQRVREYLRTH